MAQDRPSAQSEPGLLAPEQIVARYDLFSRDPVAGGDDRWTRRAGISFGRPGVSRLEPGDLSALSRRVDLAVWQYSALYFPFDLHSLPPRQRYTEVTVSLDFGRPDIVALYLSPSGFDDPGDTARALLREGDQSVTVSAFGYGMPTVSWTFEADEPGLRPHGRGVEVFVQRPRDLDDAVIALEAEAVILKPSFKIFTRLNTTLREPARHRLSFVDGSFSPVPG